MRTRDSLSSPGAPALRPVTIALYLSPGRPFAAAGAQVRRASTWPVTSAGSTGRFESRPGAAGRAQACPYTGPVPRGAAPQSPPPPPAPGAGPGSGGAGTRPVAAASGPAAGAGRLPAGGAGASRCPLQPLPPGRGGRGARAASVPPGRAARPSLLPALVPPPPPPPPLPVTPAPPPPALILRIGSPQACHSAKTQFTQHTTHTLAHTHARTHAHPSPPRTRTEGASEEPTRTPGEPSSAAWHGFWGPLRGTGTRGLGRPQPVGGGGDRAGAGAGREPELPSSRQRRPEGGGGRARLPPARPPAAPAPAPSFSFSRTHTLTPSTLRPWRGRRKPGGAGAGEVAVPGRCFSPDEPPRVQKVQVKVRAGRAGNAGGRIAARAGAGREVRGPGWAGGAEEVWWGWGGAGGGSGAQPGRSAVLVGEVRRRRQDWGSGDAPSNPSPGPPGQRPLPPPAAPDRVRSPPGRACGRSWQVWCSLGAEGGAADGPRWKEENVEGGW